MSIYCLLLLVVTACMAQGAPRSPLHDMVDLFRKGQLKHGIHNEADILGNKDPAKASKEEKAEEKEAKKEEKAAEKEAKKEEKAAEKEAKKEEREEKKKEKKEKKEEGKEPRPKPLPLNTPEIPPPTDMPEPEIQPTVEPFPDTHEDIYGPATEEPFPDTHEDIYGPATEEPPKPEPEPEPEVQPTIPYIDETDLGGGPPDGNYIHCDDDSWSLMEEDEACFKVFKHERSTWSEARSTCKMMGGDLAEVYDPETNEFVKDLLVRGLRFWIGINDEDKDGEFKHLNGDPLSDFRPWAYGEPNNHLGNERCVEMIGNGRGSWNDKRCSRRRPFVCQKMAYIIMH